MGKPAIAARPEDVTPEWLTLALRAAGAISEARVTDITSRAVGNGLVGDSVRYALTYDRATQGAPQSLVGKFAAADPQSRASGANLGLYLREVSFYRELASTVAIRTPRTFYAGLDETSQDFTLLFEDLGPARGGDQLSGCSLEDAQVAMRQAAALHGPRWDDPVLPNLDYLNTSARIFPMILAALPSVLAAYHERYDGVLEPEFMALVDALPAAMPSFSTAKSGPMTVQHGDYRLDNIMFEIKGGAEPMGTLDWQTVACGPGLIDVAYFLSAGLAPDVRRAHEVELVRLYHEALQGYGVKDYDWESCWRDYRRYALHGVFMGVFSAIAVERTKRGDALFLAMTRGACAQCLDHGAYGFWDA
ncbi:MAG TPA: phosphotransferase [Caulobacteraceae bacterium]|jgi:hypothetical protein